VGFDSIAPMETIQVSFAHQIRENPMGEVRKDVLRLMLAELTVRGVEIEPNIVLL